MTFPFILPGNKISLDFNSDPTNGVRLVRIIHHEGGNFDFVNDPARCLLSTSLWEIRGTLAAGNTPFTVDASNAAAFFSASTVGPEGRPGVMFYWPGVQIDAVNSVFVVLIVSLGTNDSVSHWWGAVGREYGNTASIDEVDFPKVCLRGPVTPQSGSGESHLLAQWRTRALIPLAILDPVPAENLPMGFYLTKTPNVGTSYDLMHPSARQVLQFSALYHADPADAQGYRRMAYVGTEDVTGFYKEFKHRFIPANENSEGFYAWTTTYFPSFANGFGVATEFGNEFISSYPSVLGALTAQTDEFWYDAAAYYRDFVQSTSMKPALYETNPLFGDSKGPTVVSLPMMVVAPYPALPPGATIYDRFLDLTRIWKKMMENPFTGVDATYMHFQNYLTGGRFGTPDTPVAQNVDPGVQPVMTQPRLENIRTSVYTFLATISKLVQPNWYAQMPLSIEAYARNGTPLGGTDGAILDYASGVIPYPATTWYSDNVHYELINTLDLTGLYLDILSGTRPQLTYDNPAFTPAHHAHGGSSFETGKREMFLNARAVGEVHEPTEQRRAAQPSVESILLPWNVGRSIRRSDGVPPGDVFPFRSGAVDLSALPRRGLPHGSARHHWESHRRSDHRSERDRIGRRRCDP